MRIPTFLTGLLLAAAAPATAAAAPSLAPLAPCYVSVGYDEATETHTAEYADVAGTGFTPGGEVTVLLDGAIAGRATADAAGSIAARVQAPRQEHGQRRFSITAVEPGGHSATVYSRVTALTVRARPRRAAWRRRVTWRGRGFTRTDLPVYAHYVRRGKARRTVRIGRPRGACGRFKVRRRQFPFKPRLGRWLVRFDQETAFDWDVETTLFDVEIQVASRPRPAKRR